MFTQSHVQFIPIKWQPIKYDIPIKPVKPQPFEYDISIKSNLLRMTCPSRISKGSIIFTMQWYEVWGKSGKKYTHGYGYGVAWNQKLVPQWNSPKKRRICISYSSADNDDGYELLEGIEDGERRTRTKQRRERKVRGLEEKNQKIAKMKRKEIW